MLRLGSKICLVIVSSLALCGCQFDGLFSNSKMASSNSAPEISGVALAAVKIGQRYQFVPSVNDPDGELVTFIISNKPRWASFSGSSGELSGTPDTNAVGNYADIVITATDGEASTSMRPFSITVVPADTTDSTGSLTAAQQPSPIARDPSASTAALSWSMPTENADGTPLTNLAGYRIYHGTSAGALSDIRDILRPDLTQYLFESLASGTHYFAITALNSAGVESALSGIGSKIIP
jgi:Putative Ig domain